MTRRIRTNAPAPLTFTSGAPDQGSVTYSRRRTYGGTNPILDGFRDLYDGHESWLDLYEATQWLRLTYDSPRIGGGVDIGVRLVGTLDGAREDNSVLGYIIGTADEIAESYPEGDPDTYMGLLDGFHPDQVQDFITHAEAVAKLALALYDEESQP